MAFLTPQQSTDPSLHPGMTLTNPFCLKIPQFKPSTFHPGANWVEKPTRVEIPPAVEFDAEFGRAALCSAGEMYRLETCCRGLAASQENWNLGTKSMWPFSGTLVATETLHVALAMLYLCPSTRIVFCAT